MHTERAHQVFTQPHKDIWLSLVMRNPRTVGRSGDHYHENELNDSFLLFLLQEAYRLFCLFHGILPSSPSSLFSPPLLAFPTYIPSNHLHSSRAQQGTLEVSSRRWGTTGSSTSCRCCCHRISHLVGAIRGRTYQATSGGSDTFL